MFLQSWRVHNSGRGSGSRKYRESQKILQFGNPESQKSRSRSFQESRKSHSRKLGFPTNYLLINWYRKSWKKVGTFSAIFFDLRKNLIPGLFGNTEVPKMLHSRTSGFPKQKNNREWLAPLNVFLVGIEITNTQCFLWTRLPGSPDAKSN